jgi:hypothetical protein
MRTRIVPTLIAAIATSALFAANAAAANQLGNGGFERPIVSGKAKEPTGSLLGHCLPLASGPGHCWQVTSDRTALIHDDFITGGVAWAPEAGHQLLWLSRPSPTGQFGGGAVHQDAAVPASTSFTLSGWYAADPSAPAGTSSAFELDLKFCNSTGTACVGAINVVLLPISTGDPAAPGWTRFRISNLATNADQTLARVDIKPMCCTGNAAGIFDAISLK